LRHANLSAAERYLREVRDNEAVRWIENLYGHGYPLGEVKKGLAHR
jgi:hypothetical protein